MRRAGLVLALAPLLLTLLLPAGTSQATPTPLAFPIAPGSGTQTIALNIQNTAVGPVRFTLTQSDFASLDGRTLQSVLVQLSKGSSRLEVALQSPAAQGGSATSWRGDLDATTPDLVKGLWSVQAIVVGTDGGTSPADTRVRNLDVQATDTTAPVIRFSGEVAGGKIRLGTGDVLAVLPEDALLRAVTYRLPGITGNLTLAFPYLIGLPAFREGPQNLTVNATDRAGNSASRTITVTRDTQPPVISVAIPDGLYVGIAHKLAVNASDTTPYNVTLQVDGKATSSPGAGPLKAHTFTLNASQAGPVAFTIRAVDAVGNAVERAYSLNATVVSTDSTVRAMALSVPRPIVGDAVSLHVTVAQKTGAVPLSLTVKVSGAALDVRNVTVTGPGEASFDAPLKLRVGRQSVTANVGAPAGVVELDATNQALTLEFEVFFAKVQNGTDTYYIRAGPSGLPLEALGPGNATYALQLVQNGSGVVYQFNVAGRNLTWDPRPAGSETVSESESGSKSAKGSPAPAPLALLGAVALALAIARRRRA